MGWFKSKQERQEQDNYIRMINRLTDIDETLIRQSNKKITISLCRTNFGENEIDNYFKIFEGEYEDIDIINSCGPDRIQLSIVCDELLFNSLITSRNAILINFQHCEILFTNIGYNAKPWRCDTNIRENVYYSDKIRLHIYNKPKDEREEIINKLNKDGKINQLKELVEGLTKDEIKRALGI